MLRIITCICLCFLGGSIAQAQRLLPKQKGISLSWVAPVEAFTSSFSDDFGVQLGYSINAKGVTTSILPLNIKGDYTLTKV